MNVMNDNKQENHVFTVHTEKEELFGGVLTVHIETEEILGGKFTLIQEEKRDTEPQILSFLVEEKIIPGNVIVVHQGED